MDRISDLNAYMDDFELYLLENECHEHSVCKKYEVKILNILNEMEADSYNILAYKSRLNQLILYINLKI